MPRGRSLTWLLVPLAALASCKLGSDVNEAPPDPLATVSTTPAQLALKVGDTASVAVATTPALSAGRATVSWVSTQPSVAQITSVAPLGARVFVKAVSPGTASLNLTFTAGAQVVSGNVFVIVRSLP